MMVLFWCLARRFKWFSFDSNEAQPTGVVAADPLQRPLLSASLRVALQKRVVDVRYQTFFELISEVGGGWTMSLIFGYGCALIIRAIVKGDCKQMCRAALHVVGLCDAGDGGVSVNDQEPQVRPTGDGDKESPMQSQQLATREEVTALAAQLEEIRRAVGKAEAPSPEGLVPVPE